ncbi:MAG TPA: hypothetical protein VM534_10890, partial [Thermoanaerobaculia bacterium]|nr:hypothetical protein [Thermoanaerobaculia bacterium]
MADGEGDIEVTLRIVLTAQLPEIALELLRGFEVEVHPTDRPRGEEELLEMFEGADGVITLVTDPVTRRVLETHPRLKVIGNFGVGTNNIDLAAAR